MVGFGMTSRRIRVLRISFHGASMPSKRERGAHGGNIIPSMTFDIIRDFGAKMRRYLMNNIANGAKQLFIDAY